MDSSRKTPRTGRNVAVILMVLVLMAGAIAVVTSLFRSPPAEADVGFTQNVQAVGEQKYVKTWTNYGPAANQVSCGGRICSGAFLYWRVSRGTATTRLTTFKVTERVRAYDYYLLDVDITTSARTGSGDGGTGTFRIHNAGTTIYDRNDSKSLDAKSSSCATVGVSMSTPWPVVGASATIGHATMCSPTASLSRTYAGSDAVYRAQEIDDVRHLTMQRWVKVAAGKHPTFGVTVVLPQDTCTHGDGDGHCVRYSTGSSTRTIAIGTTG